jgi:hypothetical protein
MTEAQLKIARRLAAGGQGGNVLASVICMLVIDGVKLGELEEISAISIDGAARTIRVLPMQWLERLGTAIERGVFEKPTPETLRKVVDRILATAPPMPLET